MKSFLSKTKNLIPYLTLIAIYFLFVNIEARKSQYRNPESIKKNTSTYKNNSNMTKEQLRIKIPVIPYNQ